MQVRLEVSHNKANVKRIVLERDAVIGRGADCNLRIASSSISRHHCKISITPTEVFVRDLGSSNGTFVDGTQIEPNEDVLVPSGTKIALGSVKFRVLYDAPAPAPKVQSELGSTVELRAVGSQALSADSELIESDPKPKTEPAVKEEKVDPKFAAKKAAAKAAAVVAAAAAAEAAQLAADEAAEVAAEAAQVETTSDEEELVESGAELFPIDTESDQVADASEKTLIVEPGETLPQVEDELVTPTDEVVENIAETISATPNQLAETTDFVLGDAAAQAEPNVEATEEDEYEEEEYEEEEVEEEESPKKKDLLGSVMGLFGRKKAAAEEEEVEYEEEEYEEEEVAGEAAGDEEDVEYEYEEEDVEETEAAAADFLGGVGEDVVEEVSGEDEGLGDFLSEFGGD